MPTPAMPPNWQPKAWPETVVFEGLKYTLNRIDGHGTAKDIARYTNPILWPATSEDTAFLQAMWQQSQEGK